MDDDDEGDNNDDRDVGDEAMDQYICTVRKVTNAP
jgi:hypothetical protein